MSTLDQCQENAERQLDCVAFVRSYIQRHRRTDDLLILPGIEQFRIENYEGGEQLVDAYFHMLNAPSSAQPGVEEAAFFLALEHALNQELRTQGVRVVDSSDQEEGLRRYEWFTNILAAYITEIAVHRLRPRTSRAAAGRLRALQQGMAIKIENATMDQ